MGLLLAACGRSPEQLIADCTSTTAFRLETDLAVDVVALDKFPASAVETCIVAHQKSGDARSAFGAGRAALAAERWDVAIEWLQRAEAAQYRRDLTQIGLMTAYVGQGDFKQAEASGREALTAGAQDAPVMLAEIYSNPQSGLYNFDLAVEHYTAASKTDFNGIYATRRLAEMHLARGKSGEGPNPRADMLQALRWSVAWGNMTPGDADAWIQAGDLVLLDAYPATEADAERIAYDNYRKAAELGNPYAAVRTGWALYFGRGTEKNKAASRPFFETAAAAGDAYAHSALAHMYWSGDGAAKNAALAEEHVLAAVAGCDQDAKNL